MVDKVVDYISDAKKRGSIKLFTIFILVLGRHAGCLQDMGNIVDRIVNIDVMNLIDDVALVIYRLLISYFKLTMWVMAVGILEYCVEHYTSKIRVTDAISHFFVFLRKGSSETSLSVSSDIVLCAFFLQWRGYDVQELVAVGEIWGGIFLIIFMVEATLVFRQVIGRFFALNA